MNPEKLDISKVLQAQFEHLPKPVQKAILSSHIEANLQVLAKKHQLHLDQWVRLENEVMMVLLGLRTITTLAEHIEAQTHITREAAMNLSTDISVTIFDPIRQELERELENPNAKAVEVSVDEESRQKALSIARKEEGNSVDSQPLQQVQSKQQTVNSGSVAATHTPPKSLASDPYREQVS